MGCRYAITFCVMKNLYALLYAVTHDVTRSRTMLRDSNADENVSMLPWISCPLKNPVLRIRNYKITYIATWNQYAIACSTGFFNGHSIVDTIDYDTFYIIVYYDSYSPALSPRLSSVWPCTCTYRDKKQCTYNINLVCQYICKANTICVVNSLKSEGASKLKL